ncbi:hypothetical protein N24_2758 [Corynebacterium suranareeae]|uniref:Endonuclease GajA/Old nuclease/RecF-like AAA domain-containing protein n=1 Tax=Corynebacterium suranareeae TaxID=2506452 RepID=A0A160PW08_9CORY|nr:AAA family ATPase [Corynebacterium suranareeae]BAU97020.1 hypothetical protein N24_2758 [Corynebacterium suranareeae]
MQISASELGPLVNPHWSPSNLNVIAGPNGSGKTYLAHAIYLLIKGLSWNPQRAVFQTASVLDDLALQLVDNKRAVLDRDELVSLVKTLVEQQALQSAWPFMNYLKSNSDMADLPLRISVDENDIEDVLFKSSQRRSIPVKTGAGEVQCVLEISASERNATLALSSLDQDSGTEFPDGSIPTDVRQINRCIGILLGVSFSGTVPPPYILSAERTGISLFQQDIDYGRSLLVEEFRIEGEKALNGVSSAIWSPAIEDNFNTFRSLNRKRNNRSFLVDEHPEILRLFDAMVSGRFVESDGEFKFAPDGATGSIPLTSTSSTVRALFELGEFLRHSAKKGQWLIIDEPELNLHPHNQILMGRLLAALSNAGLKILVTTHSDYIVRELSILVMLKQRDQIALPDGYASEYVLSPESVRVDYTEVEGDSRRFKLHSVDVTVEDGIATPFFDEAIRKQNDVFEEVMWG